MNQGIRKIEDKNSKLELQEANHKILHEKLESLVEDLTLDPVGFFGACMAIRCLLKCYFSSGHSGSYLAAICSGIAFESREIENGYAGIIFCVKNWITPG